MHSWSLSTPAFGVELWSCLVFMSLTARPCCRPCRRSFLRSTLSSSTCTSCLRRNDEYCKWVCHPHGYLQPRIHLLGVEPLPWLHAWEVLACVIAQSGKAHICLHAMPVFSFFEGPFSSPPSLLPSSEHMHRVHESTGASMLFLLERCFLLFRCSTLLQCIT